MVLGSWRQLIVLYATWQSGGHAWLQGDWLINLAGGPVRRGPFGEALRVVADTTGLSPLVCPGHLAMSCSGAGYQNYIDFQILAMLQLLRKRSSVFAICQCVLSDIVSTRRPQR